MNSLSELKEIWQAVYALLEKDFSNSTLNTWFGNIELVFLGEDVVLLTIDKDFKKKFIDLKYIDILKDHFYTVLGFEVEVEIYSDAIIRTAEDAEHLYGQYLEEKRIQTEKQNQKEMEKAIKIISPNKKSSLPTRHATPSPIPTRSTTIPSLFTVKAALEKRTLCTLSSTAFSPAILR